MIIPTGIQTAARAAVATVAFATVQLSNPLASVAEVGYIPSSSSSQIEPPRLKACNANTNCISSGYIEPPNRYMSPLKTLSDKETAYRRAVRDLSNSNNNNYYYNKIETISKDFYIHIEVPGTAPGPKSIDDIELLFTNDNIVNLRCEARVTLPPPPFCVQKNCINGNMDQRRRVEDIARILGLPSADYERMAQTAKWSPIFFNSDRVPGFDDDDY
jgi:uncharacterized protein (DUF1499 family)